MNGCIHQRERLTKRGRGQRERERGMRVRRSYKWEMSGIKKNSLIQYTKKKCAGWGIESLLGVRNQPFYFLAAELFSYSPALVVLSVRRRERNQREGGTLKQIKRLYGESEGDKGRTWWKGGG